MGKFKDLDHALRAPELNEGEVMELQLQALKNELERIESLLMEVLDKDRYYGRPITREPIEFIYEELQRIVRDLT